MKLLRIKLSRSLLGSDSAGVMAALNAAGATASVATARAAA